MMLTAAQVAPLLGLSRTKVYDLQRSGELPGYRFGSSVRFDPKEVQEYVDLHTVGAVLGHRSSASTRRYAHLATDNLKAAIGRIGRKAA